MNGNVHEQIGERRDQLAEIIRREFIGPDPIDLPGCIQENGEEILQTDPPHIRYIAGVLFPQATSLEVETLELEYNPLATEESLSKETTFDDQRELGGSGFELLQQEEEVLNLSNAFHQSAISLTAAIQDGSVPFVRVSAGVYSKQVFNDPKAQRKITQYLRSQINWDNDGRALQLPDKNNRMIDFLVLSNEVETKLHFLITYRYRNSDNSSTIYTFTLRNVTTQEPGEAIRDEDCYFQAGFSLFSDNFSPLPESKRVSVDDEDYLSNELLYRNVKSYAIGHGCSAYWDNKEQVSEIRTEIFPFFEVKPIVPNQIQGVSLDMYELSDIGNFNNAVTNLELLCKRYDEWIEELRTRSLELDIKFQKTAERHILSCSDCKRRMVDGVNLLKTNEKVRKAFQYMNRAMLLQQLHYSMPLQLWQDAGNNTIKLMNPVEQMPDPYDKNTWYGNPEKYGKWRPFQLAFIIMNLSSMAFRECDDRKEVDLIWFPTGGGKTEAYLGLSAYAIFIRKLLNPSDFGTTILMRYTLRLLTSQQYERAAAMICACESIRKEKETELGTNRISIGLWVGKSTTPNKMADAVASFERLYNGKQEENPFLMLKCPWCGAQMGPVSIGGKQKRLPGYKKRITGKAKSIIFQCGNERCIYSKDENPLPLLIIDEAIYKNPPTLLLGTVDKFAMLPFIPEAQSLFGIHDGYRKTSPDLIIQDELHLISGPLGSMVGHYETMINELCTDRRDGKEIAPKIITSTATISRAKAQCNALYNCGKEHVFQFPPSGIDAGDSFFATEDKESNGRKYMGILAAGASSYATTTIRLYAAILFAASEITVSQEEERDPYWTNIGYFNSLRELGQAATWVSADIDEYLHTIYRRRQKKQERYIYEFDELTSRISGESIPTKLQALSVKYPSTKNEKRPIDICLATNMISVGVDVPRLGLMTVTGQPKTTSEYIQATSRIGRSKDAPGIVFTTYNPGKPRDKSYYEQFRTYHSKLYSHVEPTSVTPFSAPLRERALHAVLIGLVRLFGTPEEYNNPDNLPTKEDISRLFELIINRVASVDPDELENTKKHLNEIMRDWKAWKPQKYHDFLAGDVVPLMYPAGSIPNSKWENRGMATPTSMRSVDASCEVQSMSHSYKLEVD